MEQANSWEVNN